MMDFEIVKSLRHGLQGSGQIFERTNFLPVRPVSTEPFKSVTGLQHCLHESFWSGEKFSWFCGSSANKTRIRASFCAFKTDFAGPL